MASELTCFGWFMVLILKSYAINDIMFINAGINHLSCKELLPPHVDLQTDIFEEFTWQGGIWEFLISYQIKSVKPIYFSMEKLFFQMDCELSCIFLLLSTASLGCLL